MYSYGFDKQNKNQELISESLFLNGYYVLKNVLQSEELKEIRVKIDKYLLQQESVFTNRELESIGEVNQLRAPIQYDEVFLNILMKPQIIDFVKGQLGEYYILQQQNAVVNQPNSEHHQSAWHRDLPYLNLTSSKLLAVNAYFCIDEFNPRTGATFFVPHTHKADFFPSDQYLKNNAIQVNAEAGDVILFDTMIIHRAGENISDYKRRGINSVFSRSIIRQQIDYSVLLKDKYQNHSQEIQQILGFDCASPSSVKEFRQRFLYRKSK